MGFFEVSANISPSIGQTPIYPDIITIIVGVLFTLLWFGFIWKIIRAQLRVPKELAAIRVALERIADQMEKKDRS